LARLSEMCGINEPPVWDVEMAKTTLETWNAASKLCWQSVQEPCGRPIVFKNCRCSWNRS